MSPPSVMAPKLSRSTEFRFGSFALACLRSVRRWRQERGGLLAARFGERLGVRLEQQTVEVLRGQDGWNQDVVRPLGVEPLGRGQRVRRDDDARGGCQAAGLSQEPK